MLRPALLLASLQFVCSCTNFIVTKGASLEGHNSFSYTDDGGNNYGEITLLPAADHPPGSQRQIWRWEDGVYLGQIPEANHTYRVVGNMNEHQLAIGETTFTGRPELRNPKEIATMDYANLMSISLQRARTAREAIALIDQLTIDHGYASTGESLTISDPHEVWHLEIVGKGKEKGAAWVARRVPDGYIGAHANQARITTFPLDEPDTTKYSTDLLAWARRAGLFPEDAPDATFDFSAVANPISFHGSRYGEVRVWDFFRRVVTGFEAEYETYVRGYDLSRRMPLWVRPERPVSLNDTFWWMRSHFEGTRFDMTADVGAGPYGAAYRARPTAWSAGGVEYANLQRTTSRPAAPCPLPPPPSPITLAEAPLRSRAQGVAAAHRALGSRPGRSDASGGAGRPPRQLAPCAALRSVGRPAGQRAAGGDAADGLALCGRDARAPARRDRRRVVVRRRRQRALGADPRLLRRHGRARGMDALAAGGRRRGALGCGEAAVFVVAPPATPSSPGGHLWLRAALHTPEDPLGRWTCFQRQ